VAFGNGIAKDFTSHYLKRVITIKSLILKTSFLARFRAILMMLVMSSLAACSMQPDESIAPADKQIRALMDAQQLAWNRGDIEDFMQGYWHDDRLRFESGTTTMSGWQATYDRYLKRYPDRAAMGTLQFSNVQITTLDKDHATATGGWALLGRANDVPHGTFVLDLRRFDKNWKIVKDHTESAS
jgi:hypothetical protein